MLESQDQEEEAEAQGVEEQEGPGIGPPAHVVLRGDARQVVEAALQGPHHGIQEGALPLEDPAHVLAQGLREGEEQEEEDHELGQGIGAHWNLSGCSRAKPR